MNGKSKQDPRDRNRTPSPYLPGDGASTIEDPFAAKAAEPVDQLASQSVLHYRLLSLLGAGGMGQVYRAVDTRLQRLVALKFLRLGNPDDATKRRFRHEARVTAALDHPNICAIHAMEDFEGGIFLVMPCLAGRTLKERLKEGTVAIEEILRIALQVGAGLDAAHARGVVHRDIKPSNIMLTDDDRILILDFGLARLGNVVDPAEIGRVVGTVSYMSPEQSRGDPVDERTDIWSLGIVIFEMIAGQTPFRGDRWQVVRDAILTGPMPSMEAIREDLPPELGRIVQTALAKDPADRYQSMQELLESIRSVRRSLDDDVPRAPARARSHNLPRRLTSFVGRSSEMSAVGERLAASRLVTLTGAGGSGKTSLALQIAETMLPEIPGGAWLVELAPLSDPDLIPQVVAEALAIRQKPGMPAVENLYEALASQDLLIVLDNCEHLIDACARFAEDILGACPDLRILATSREPLSIPGEALYHVPPLEIPPTAREGLGQGGSSKILTYDSARLFVERAQAVDPGFRATEDNAATLVHICRRLDGIPLALELAAVRVSTMTLEQIASRLDDRFKLLSVGRRTAVPRHQTLLATVEWSHGLLSERERALFRRLAVFAGGWTLEGAEAVAASQDIAGEEVLDLLSNLVSKSLVVLDTRDEPRYRFLETLRDYARKELAASGESADIGRRHLDVFLRLAEAFEDHFCGPDQIAWMNRLRDEQDNLRTAMNRAATVDVAAGLRIGAAVVEFWFHRDHFGDGRAQLLGVLSLRAAQEPTAERAKALNAAAWLLSWALGEYDEARRLAAEALAIGEAKRNPLIIGRALLALGISALGSGDPAAARRILERARDRLAAVDATGHLGDVYHHLGNVDLQEGEDIQAREDFELALRCYEAVGHLSKVAGMSRHRANIALRLGDLQTAAALTRRSVELNTELGSETGVIACLVSLGRIVAARGQRQTAAVILGAVDGLLRKYRTHLFYADGVEYEALQATLHECLTADRLEVHRDEGRLLDRDDAVAMALDAAGGRPSSTSRHT